MPTPLEVMKARVSGLKAELVRMQQEPTSSLKAGRTPWDVLVEEAGAAIGGALTSNVLGRRGIGSRAGRAIVRHQRVTQAGQITLARRMRAVTVLTRLRAEVAASGEEVDERFRAGLMRLLAEAETAHRPDTILRRTGEIMDRLLSYAPHDLATGPSDDYLLLKKLEESLRGFIVRNLSAVTPDWWWQRVPDDVRSNAEQRKATRKLTWPWYEGQDLPPIYYVDFSDYTKIISKKDNWREAFVGTFGDVELIRTKLRELEPIRNDVAHGRDLSEHSREKLRLYSRDVLRIISNRQ